MRHGGRTTLARAVFPIAQPQSPRPCIFPLPAPPRKARFPARACPDHPACPCPHSPTQSSQRSQWPLRFPDATANGSSVPLPRPPFAGPSLPPTCASPARPKTAFPPSCRVRHSQAPLPRRPALPRATENGSSALLPRLPIADPLPVDLRFPVRPRTDCPHSCRVRHSQALSPADLRFPRATANVPARGFSQAPGDGLRPSGMALAVPPRHVGQKMFKFYNSLKIALSPVDSGMHACYNVPSGYPVVCATPVLLPTDSKKDSGSVSVDVMPPISDRPGKAANGRRSPPCLSGG